MRIAGEEPNPNRLCELATRYPFRVARNIAGSLVGKKADEYLEEDLTSLLRRAKCLLMIFRA